MPPGITTFSNDAQIRHRLETEFVCVAALCGNREATEKLAAYLESNLLTVVPGLETLTLADQLDVSKKLMDLSNFSIKVAHGTGQPGQRGGADQPVQEPDE